MFSCWRDGCWCHWCSADAGVRKRGKGKDGKEACKGRLCRRESERGSEIAQRSAETRRRKREGKEVRMGPETVEKASRLRIKVRAWRKFFGRHCDFPTCLSAVQCALLLLLPYLPSTVLGTGLRLSFTTKAFPPKSQTHKQASL